MGFLQQFKERFGEFELYNAIRRGLSGFGKDEKLIEHICENCQQKIRRGSYTYHQSLFNSFFEEKTENNIETTVKSPEKINTDELTKTLIDNLKIKCTDLK